LVELVWVIRRTGGYREPDNKEDRTEPRIALPLLVLFILVIPIVVGYARIGVFSSYVFYPGLGMWIWISIYSWGVLWGASRVGLLELSPVTG
jgi:hypothetical protein